MDRHEASSSVDEELENLITEADLKDVTKPEVEVIYSDFYTSGFECVAGPMGTNSIPKVRKRIGNPGGPVKERPMIKGRDKPSKKK